MFMPNQPTLPELRDGWAEEQQPPSQVVSLEPLRLRQWRTGGWLNILLTAQAIDTENFEQLHQQFGAKATLPMKINTP